MTQADAQCRLEWTHLAAIGAVTSDHGRSGTGRPDINGLVQPALIGPMLEQADGTTVPDSDLGRLDGDQKHDRAIGPLMLTPALWGVVGVDADNDGIREPQDTDDAALAVAVLLCSGDTDLTDATQEKVAISRLNGAPGFARAVRETRAALELESLTLVRPGVVAPVGVVAPEVPQATVTATAWAMRLVDIRRSPSAGDASLATPSTDAGATGGPGAGSTTTATASATPSASPSATATATATTTATETATATATATATTPPPDDECARPARRDSPTPSDAASASVSPPAGQPDATETATAVPSPSGAPDDPCPDAGP